MNDIFKKIISDAKKFSLSKREKEEMMQKIFSHVKNNPANSEVASPYVESVIITSTYSYIWYNRVKPKLLLPVSVLEKNKYVPAVILVMIMLSGGTALAANHALPGDILYPVKINVTERLQSTFAFGAAADAKVEAEQANTRLQEVEQLSTNSTISSATKDEIKANFSQHADKVTKLIANLKAQGDEKDATAVDSQFENTLRQHNLTLTEISKNDKRNSDKIEEINAEVNAHLNDRAGQRMDEGRSNNSDNNNSSSPTDNKNSGTKEDGEHKN